MGLALGWVLFWIGAAHAQIEFVDRVSELRGSSREDLTQYAARYRTLFEAFYGREYGNRPVPWDPAEIRRWMRHLALVRRACGETEKRFVEMFGGRPRAKFYAWVSGADTDGITATVDGEHAFSLNLRIGVQYSLDELHVLIAHEMFHVFQGQLPSGAGLDGSLLSEVMSEGWASYASELLFPGLPEWKYVSYFKKDDTQWRSYLEHDRAIRAAIDRDQAVKGWAATKRYLVGDAAMTAPLPPRSAYYLGYRLARDFFRERRPQLDPRAWARTRFSEFRASFRRR